MMMNVAQISLTIESFLYEELDSLKNLIKLSIHAY